MIPGVATFFSMGGHATGPGPISGTYTVTYYAKDDEGSLESMLAIGL